MTEARKNYEANITIHESDIVHVDVILACLGV